MEDLLFINACVRGQKSRTLQLARRFLGAWQHAHPEAVITELDLCRDRLSPQYPEVLEERDALWSAGKLDDPLFQPARQFAAAGRIVIAAPFWDLSFPAILKIYLERISVTNITFGYDDLGRSVGLCKADKLLLITTRGGDFSIPEISWMEMGACAPCTAFPPSSVSPPRGWTTSATTRRPFCPRPWTRQRNWQKPSDIGYEKTRPGVHSTPGRVLFCLRLRYQGMVARTLHTAARVIVPLGSSFPSLPPMTPRATMVWKCSTA